MIELPDNVAQGSQQPGQVESLTSGEIAAMKALMARMEDQIATQQKQLDVKDSQIRELHILLQQAQAALPSPQSAQRPWWRLWQRG